MDDTRLRNRIRWGLGFALLPCPCHWYGRLLWRVRQPLGDRLLRNMPEDQWEYIEGPWDWPEGTIVTMTNESAWNYTPTMRRD